MSSKSSQPTQLDSIIKLVCSRLNTKIISLIGMMGSGKSTVGNQLANLLDIPFVDSDKLIEEAAGMPISEIFSDFGEESFRDLEQKIIKNNLKDGPKVFATGGGSFLNPNSRNAIQKAGVVVWLDADIDILFNRIKKSKNRPLLQKPDPEAVLKQLLHDRTPIYAMADIKVKSSDSPIHSVLENIIFKLNSYLRKT